MNTTLLENKIRRIVIKVLKEDKISNSIIGETVEFYNSTFDTIVCLITDFELNEKNNGFKISFRYYDITQENGGFETTLWVANCNKDLAKGFCGLNYEYKRFAKRVGATITSFKTDNKVPVKFTFDKIKNRLK